ncbi:MAG: hypothetical protein ACJ784_17485, partial [Myxococcales bacterium]
QEGTTNAQASRRVVTILHGNTVPSGIRHRGSGTSETRAPRRAWRKLLPVAAAAVLLVGIAIGRTGRDDERVRTKGGASARLFQQIGKDVVTVGRDGAVANGPLQLELASPDRSQTVILFLEGHDATILYAGPSKGARAPFDWVGPAKRASLVAVLSDMPLDAEAIRRDVAERGPDGAPKGSEVLVRPIERIER